MNAAQIIDWIDDLKEEIETLKRENVELKTCLHYCTFERWPLGNTTFDNLPDHWQQHIQQVFANKTKEAK